MQTRHCNRCCIPQAGSANDAPLTPDRRARRTRERREYVRLLPQRWWAAVTAAARLHGRSVAGAAQTTRFHRADCSLRAHPRISRIPSLFLCRDRCRPRLDAARGTAAGACRAAEGASRPASAAYAREIAADEVAMSLPAARSSRLAVAQSCIVQRRADSAFSVAARACGGDPAGRLRSLLTDKFPARASSSNVGFRLQGRRAAADQQAYLRQRRDPCGGCRSFRYQRTTLTAKVLVAAALDRGRRSRTRAIRRRAERDRSGSTRRPCRPPAYTTTTYAIPTSSDRHSGIVFSRSPAGAQRVSDQHAASLGGFFPSASTDTRPAAA